jgi:hypothetical protein
MINWRRIEDVLNSPGPFIERAERSGLSRFKFD